jgi:VWFA-related protein
MSKRSRPTLPLTALAVAATLIHGVAAAAQDERPGVFGEVLDVRVVNVEVVVTDRDGNRVHGLLPQDFVLEVDGEPTPITFFNEVVGGTVAAASAGAVSVPGATAGAPLGTSFLVFVDDYFTIGRERDQVLDALQAQVGNLSPHDRMAVVAYDGRRLEMLTSWTSSKPALERAFEAARARPADGLQRLAEQRSFLADQLLSRPFTDRRGAFTTGNQLDIDERHNVEQLAGQVRRATAAASATLRAFANPPGRKVMLLMSGGWPWRPVDYLIDPRGLITTDTPDGEELYGPLVDTANLLGYTLYPIDIPGITENLSDAELRAPVGDRIEVRREQELHYTLSNLAERTGGREMLNANRLVALTEAVEDTRSFYWLGFSPQRQGDDAEHEIEVTVARSGLKVRLRDSFRDLSRQAEVSMAIESSLLFGNAASAEPLVLVLGKPERGRKMRVPIEVMVPVGKLTAVQVGNEWVTTAELRVAAQDEEGNTAPIPVLPLELRLASPPVEGEMARFRTTIQLRRAPHDLVVALYEPTSGKVFSAAARITP